MKKILQNIRDLIEKAQAMCLTDSQSETVTDIDRFCGFLLDMDNTLGNADYVINRIRSITEDAQTVEEFVRWTFESISQDAYMIARNWMKGMSADEVLFYNQDTCQLMTESELGTLDLEEFGIAFTGDLSSCLKYVCSLLENIASRSADDLPELTEDEIENIRTILSQTKEECFDGAEGYWEEEPEFDANDIYAQDQHRRWSEESWTKYDELSIEVLGIQEGKLQQLILYLKENKADAKVGDIYDILSEIENKESA